MARLQRALFFSIVFLLILILTSCANLPSEESINQGEPVIPTGSNENGQYTEDDFIDYFFQFDHKYVNTYIQIGLAEDEMKEYFEMTGRNNEMMGAGIQKGERVSFPNDYGVRFYLFTYPIMGRCDFYEIYPSFLFETIPNDHRGITGHEFVDYFDIYPPIPDDSTATHLRVVIKGTLQGEDIFDTKPVGAYYDLPIELFSNNE
ncbi:MAG: hypothetical protein K8R40_11310 [Anaerolineaceae bacterium]|nr:hypothetical protein [Anaerolineaceae bacterium]